MTPSSLRRSLFAVLTVALVFCTTFELEASRGSSRRPRNFRLDRALDRAASASIDTAEYIPVIIQVERDALPTLRRVLRDYGIRVQTEHADISAVSVSVPAS